MGPKIQITADCADVTVAMAFWGPALGYVREPPPAGHASWDAYATKAWHPPVAVAGRARRSGRDRPAEGNEFCVQ